MSIICIGDFGNGGPQQYNVANLINQVIKQKKTQFILGLGDNIYPFGVKSQNDSQFIDKFEKPYESLPDYINFYNVLGNHDYFGNVQAQIEYQNLSKRWIMPNKYYYFEKILNDVRVEFYAIDTNLYSSKYLLEEAVEQESYLLNKLKESPDDNCWRIIFGHHPWRSTGFHGHCNVLLESFLDKMHQTKKIDLYISGHDHDNQHISIPDKPHMLISGTGAKTRYIPKTYRDLKSYYYDNYLLHYSENPGFINLNFSIDELEVEIYSLNNYPKSNGILNYYLNYGECLINNEESREYKYIIKRVKTNSKF